MGLQLHLHPHHADAGSVGVHVPTLEWMGALHCTTQEISETDE